MVRIGLALFGGLLACAAAGSTIEETLGARWTAAYNSGDIAALGARYADDARVQHGHCAAVIGRGAIEEFWRGDMGEGSARTHLSVVDSFTLEHLIYVSGQYAVEVEGVPVPHIGTYMQIWRRADSATSWSIHRETWTNLACTQTTGDAEPPADERTQPIGVDL